MVPLFSDPRAVTILAPELAPLPGLLDALAPLGTGDVFCAAPPEDPDEDDYSDYLGEDEFAYYSASVSDTVAGFAKVYSTHSVVPFFGHQWKKEPDSSPEERGSSWSLIARGFWPPDVRTRLVDAMVGKGCGRALDSRSGIQTIISPRPRFAHA